MGRLLHVVLVFSPEAVLGAEDGLQLARENLRNDIRSGVEPTVQRRLIGQEPDPISFKFLPIGFSKSIQSCENSFHDRGQGIRR
jgi:hypothetical protein